jgi:hypothetical protein
MNSNGMTAVLALPANTVSAPAEARAGWIEGSAVWVGGRIGCAGDGAG